MADNNDDTEENPRNQNEEPLVRTISSCERELEVCFSYWFRRECLAMEDACYGLRDKRLDVILVQPLYSLY